jgi:signal transduction histidine kinase/HAMP domain-containing protein
MNPGISLGIFDLSGVIMLVLAGTSIIYITRLKTRSDSSLMLLWFFLCIILSAIATIITNIGIAWDWAFAPFQDAMLILSGVFLVRFAYLFPTNDQPSEARLVVTVFSVITLAALSYAVSFAIRYIAYLPKELEEYQAYYLVLPVMIILTVSIFFRRSIHYERIADQSAKTESESTGHFFKSLMQPDNRTVIALRNYGLALEISLVPVVALVLKNILHPVLGSFLFNFGVVIAITALMLTYLNYAPEPVSISAKLVGLSLVSVLLILGLAGVWVIETSSGLLEHNIVVTFIILVVASSLLIILGFPIFFRTAIINPLDRILKGVKTANEGNLNIEVEVQHDDEIGYLTHSFNRMVSSLNDLTQALQEESVRLEQQVDERTEELSTANKQLSSEVEERKATETMLDRQLHYQQAISACSQSLLQVALNGTSQLQILNQALENLRTAAQASRAYIHQKFEDPELGPCVRILAEVCEPGIFKHIDIPVNQKIPLGMLPSELITTLAIGKPLGGPTVEVFASTPSLLENFRKQENPLLSIQLFPIVLKGEWWGYVGFDDCVTSRSWDDWEVSLLGTASEMIGNTLLRWDVETRLRQMMEDLEERIKVRTADLNTLNETLLDEIQNRELLHSDLENRLHIEQELAVISTRLQDIANPRTNLIASLEDLGHIMESEDTFLIEYEPNTQEQIRDVYEWHLPDSHALSIDIILANREQLASLTEQLQTGQTVIIEDTKQMATGESIESQVLLANQVNSLLLKPLIIDNNLRGVLGCSNIQASVRENQTNIRAFELVAGIISNLLQREYLIQTLEEQVTERTRQLTAFLDMAIMSDQAQELADILQPTLITIIELSSSDACCIHLAKEGSETLEMISQQGIPYDYISPLREISFGNLFELQLQEPSNDQSNILEKITFPSQYNIPVYHTHFAARLLAGGKLQGLLSCYRVDDQPFSPFQQTILSALGELLGIIVENHRLRIESEELAAVEERQRLAREIHDAISQSVYSLSLFARSAKDAHDTGDNEKLLTSLQDLETTALQAMREMRLLLYQLRETGIEEDIPSALEIRFNQVERRLGVHATCETNSDVSLPKDIKHEVWRIIIEALNNIIKHANATNVQVELSINGEQLVVSIQDDGIGFDNQVGLHGMGLKNMQTRADRLGGNLIVNSAPGHGTLVKLDVPLTGLDIG